ncbi:multiheme c-type cytochrome [Anaeromyxobacter oryzisoli]|uniref:multiheme c-type cytochrome n=1 Tax=Anaeromyxobacter oryzisoli TaxID=2925408 RepID=UPI001F58EA7D|nr:multiheme c-type cytochrome [Anaeromyxobacter sp. SG63]
MHARHVALLAALCLAPVAFAATRGGTRKASAATSSASAPARSRGCVDCHSSTNPGIVEQWHDSGHARKGVGCLDCHQASKGDADAFEHGGELVATVVTPRDCGRCHRQEAEEFGRSHHAKAGNILASLDNGLAETVEGARLPFAPHGTAAGRGMDPQVNGMASAQAGCQQCHGNKTALKAKSGAPITVDDLKPGPDGRPTQPGVLDRILRDGEGKPVFVEATWPNAGIGRINLDGSLGSCSACHSRHDFSRRRARQPENCGTCHLGPDHPQKEIYEESKHGIAYRDARDRMNLDGKSWVLGKDYSAAPTCATCHMSANVNGGKVTHDPGERLSWTNRPPVSQPMDTDAEHRVVTETDPAKRKAAVVDTALQKRERMKEVCTTCHASSTVDAAYKQYDDLVVLYDEKFAKPGQALMKALYDQGLLTKAPFDEQIEWDWFELHHHQGRRARHGAAMMAPDYAHWHGMYEVAQTFYEKVVPEAREIVAHAAARGQVAQAKAVQAVLDEILARPEHAWYLQERAKEERK